MHFKSDWKEKFDSETTQEDFQLPDLPPVKVEMMFGQFQVCTINEITYSIVNFK